MEVRLSVFKINGTMKYVTYYHSWLGEMFLIHEEVTRFLNNKTLPGLTEGHDAYFVLVEVPTHPYNHPKLIIPEEWSVFSNEEAPTSEQR